MRSTSLALACLACLAANVSTGCGAATPPVEPPSGTSTVNGGALVTNDHAVREVAPSRARAVEAILEAPDRLETDRRLDARRQSAELLAFLRVRPGMRVAEIAAGGGYTTELLARAVQPNGTVFAENSPALLARAGIGAAWTARLARPVNARVVRVDRELAAPLPDDARELDLVYVAYDHSALERLGVAPFVDRAAFAALRVGGRYVVLDRAETPSIHAEESRHARFAIEDAGFAFGEEGRFLRTSSDPRDWDAAPTAQAQALAAEEGDRFVLSFVKPPAP